jgi:aspartate carbamoyltransferase catalytic subunit
MKHLLSIADFDRPGIDEMLDLSEHFLEVTQRDIPKVPALRGKVVVSLFYEDSTRTRISFETAAKRLSCDVMSFSVGSSSVQKGESLRDTVQTIEAMGIDALVVRHMAAGAPHRVSTWVDATVVNAGDGCHEHPTQALLDALTLRRHLGADLSGARIAIVGDILHSRVARSGSLAFSMLGAAVTLVAPPTLLPSSLDGWPVTVSHDLDAVLPDVDVVYLLRIQHERRNATLFPSLREYTARYGLTVERAARLRKDALVMHPGPMNRGVEIAAEVAEAPGSLITEQVTNGVAVRMAVLYTLLGSGASVSEPGGPASSERPNGAGASVSEPGSPASSERPNGGGGVSLV